MTRIGDLAAASASIVLTDAAAPGISGRVDVRITGSVIADVSPAGATVPPADATVVPLDGRVVAPAFVEPHLHLDKALLGTPAEGGDLGAAIAFTAERKRAFTHADVEARAERVLAAALRAGTTAIRAQTEVDPTVGLLSIQVMRELAQRHRAWLELQIAVFPQEGIRARPGTLALMREALTLPGTIVGGCPYTESDAADARAHVDQVLDLAAEFGTHADLHLDLADDTSDERFALAGYVARATRERGLEGRVAIGHVTTLAAMEPGERGRVLDDLASAAVSVVVLPATDLYLMGRSDAANVRRGIAPVSDLWAHGVRTALSSNNLRNAFTPTGRADPLDIALLAGRVGFASSREDFLRLHRAVTTDAAAVLGSERARGLTAGAPADLVVFDSTEPDTVVLDQPARLLVLAGGRPAYSATLEESFHDVPLPA
ncbi:cytosine deaminase [Microbacterium sp. BE35]|uniref:amidohydrolase family protein n=1 Tax=Microbacterium sp. BE35 TaxID=2817773 RepID=UPI002863C377|nr:amidohydrolase family protein [Microbacterium sp. BE35]MDR7191089.1 cytosine deaminase [Microbacterium sp. BE35]